MDNKEVYDPKTLNELVELTKRITEEKQYLLMENKHEQAILVDIQTANAFNTVVDLISENRYNKLSEFFDKYGVITTLNKTVEIILKVREDLS